MAKKGIEKSPFSGNVAPKPSGKGDGKVEAPKQQTSSPNRPPTVIKKGV